HKYAALDNHGPDADEPVRLAARVQAEKVARVNRGDDVVGKATLRFRARSPRPACAAHANSPLSGSLLSPKRGTSIPMQRSIETYRLHSGVLLEEAMCRPA